MKLFNILDINEDESVIVETPLTECKWCEAYHAEDSEFCCQECEANYWKEYGDDTEGCDKYHADKDEELSNN